ncbi:MAG: galactokinase [Dehalococcoidia bacterium]
MDAARLQRLVDEATARFGSAGGACRAPGRVNLIGDHTDYQDGLVLPMAIDRDTWCVGTRRSDRLLRLCSLELDEPVDVSLDDLRPEKVAGWARYPAGVAWAIEQSGRTLTGMDLLVQSTVPIGAGLSSSAAIELACALTLEFGSGFTVRPEENARLCRQAENEFVGVASGIMDQYVGALGEEGQALLIDCRSLRHRTVALPTDAQIAVLDSGTSHELKGSGYEDRRAETDRAVTILRDRFPEIRALRDVTLTMLEQMTDQLPLLEAKRARHVVSENVRVLAAADALDCGDLVRLGEVMNESHTSLRDDFQSSLPEIDILAEAARRAGALGARITGGGFGGAVVALLHGIAFERFQQEVGDAYTAETGRQATIFLVHPSPGAGPVVIEDAYDGVRTRIYRLPDGRYLTDYRFADG